MEKTLKEFRSLVQKRRNLAKRGTDKARLIYYDKKIEKQSGAVKALIQAVNDEEMRRLLTYRYVACLSWERVADNVGGTGDSCRMTVRRFFGKS